MTCLKVSKFTPLALQLKLVCALSVVLLFHFKLDKIVFVIYWLGLFGLKVMVKGANFRNAFARTRLDMLLPHLDGYEQF